ncbi:putative proteasome component [Clavispora lusitaniae]|uniref:Proteasome component n=1 Tax=Clavispora lusitaniae TaxID=36911 RepID=A0AA91T0Q1_CLALS|nr:putative proteasome component [Clavispora lusitaniae]
MYFESEDDDQRILVGMASEAVSRYCGSDVFESVAGAFLPLAFIGRHDPLESVKSFFDREWIESSSGNNAIKVYFEEITTLCKIYGQSPNYNIRKIIAKALADMATTIEIDSDPQTTELLALLLELSKGKSWDGKDLVLKALVGFSTKKTLFLNGHEDILEQVTKTVQTEARRRNKAYQMKAVLSLGQYVHSYPSEVEAVDTYIDVMQTVLTRDYFEEADVLSMSDLENGKTDAQKEAKIEELYLSYIGNIFESLSPSHLNADILKLAHDKMKHLRESDDVSLTWRTCASFNEHMGILLKSILEEQTELTTSQLDLISETFTELTNFGEQYRLEKNLVLFARNSKMFIELLSRHGVSYKTQFVLEFIDNLKKENTSTVALYELGLATDN